MSAIDHKLKVSFRNLFPEYARELDAAKNQKEIDVLHERFIDEARQNLANVLGKDVMELSDADQTAPIPLSDEQYKNLINGTGDTIKSQLQVLIDGLGRLKNMDDDDPGLITAQILLAGALGVGVLSTGSVITALVEGAVAAAAAYVGVTVASVAVVCAIAVLIIVAIIIPIIYFMMKPANCIILLINELDKPLVFKDDYNVSGKPRLMTSPIPKGVVIPGVGKYPVAGFIATEKKSNALIGTQYGFTMGYGEMNLSFGVECPLTSMFTDNNCYCRVDESAKMVAEKTSDKDKESWTDTKNGVTLSIKCNSGSGSIAYYVARAYKN